MTTATLYDRNGLAERLAVSPRQVDSLDAQRKLPRPLRLGRLRRWDPAEIDRWIEAGCPSRDDWEARR